jgi:hypothetical protein
MDVPIFIGGYTPLSWIQCKSVGKVRFCRNVIAFILTAISTRIFRFLVTSSLRLAIPSLVLWSGTPPVSLFVSSVEIMYLRFPVAQQ